jgi:hypothetical protein
VKKREVGGTLGLSAALDGLTRVVSPVLGGLLIDRLGTPAPGALGALIMAGLIVFTWRRILYVPDIECPPPVDAVAAAVDAGA